MELFHSIELFKQDFRLVEHFIDAIISIDKDDRITFWNYGASSLFGYTQTEALGREFNILFTESNKQQEWFEDVKMTSAQQPGRGEIALRQKNGERVHCKFLLSGYGDEHNLVIILRNISEQRSLEQLVELLRTQLAEQSSQPSDKLARLYEQINEGFIAFDEHWNYTHINKKASEMFGRKPDELLGKNVWKEFPKAKESNFYSIYLEAMRTQQSKRIQDYSAELDRWFEVDVFPSPKGLSVLFHDISELKRTSKLLSERETLYRNIVETAQEGIWTIDKNNKTTFVNSAVANMLGYDRQEIIGREPFKFIEKESLAKAKENLDRIFLGESIQVDYQLVTKSGSTIWVWVHSTPLYSEDRYSGALAMIVDITERRLRENELKASFEQLRELAGMLQTIREEERSSIARELHDELGQQLTALKMDAYWVKKNIKTADAAIERRLQRITEISDLALDIVEKKAMELHPGVLHNLGLLAALEWQNSEFQERYQVLIDLNVCGKDDNLPLQLSVALYRIYQEALHNIGRHANASVVKTEFYRDNKMVGLKISDNGEGFESNILTTKKSLGVLSMKERSAMLGGTFKIDSQPGHGTTVSVQIPSLQ